MNKFFVVLTLLVTLSGCAGVGVNPYRPMSAAASVFSDEAEKLVQRAKGVPGGQSYESRRFDNINGYPSAQWSAGSWVGKPPPYGFGYSFGGWNQPMYPIYPRY